MAWEHDSVAKHHQVTSPHEGVGLAAKPGDIIVTVSGGQGQQSFFLPIGGYPVSQLCRLRDPMERRFRP
jgi:hypothetical protein